MWGLINSLQIVLHLPLINYYFPANAMILFSFLINIATFNLINTQPVESFFFRFP